MPLVAAKAAVPAGYHDWHSVSGVTPHTAPPAAHLRTKGWVQHADWPAALSKPGLLAAAQQNGQARPAPTTAAQPPLAPEPAAEQLPDIAWDSAALPSMHVAPSPGALQPPTLEPLPLSEDEEQDEEDAIRFFDDSAQGQPVLLAPSRMRSRSVKDAARVRHPACPTRC